MRNVGQIDHRPALIGTSATGFGTQPAVIVLVGRSAAHSSHIGFMQTGSNTRLTGLHARLVRIVGS
ncbi:MAG TPA: hypothetical protein VGB67_12795 [Fibrella sp.]